MRDGRSAKTSAKGTECVAGADYTTEDTAFIFAMAAWQKRHKVRYPAATDFLTVLKSLGYVLQKPGGPYDRGEGQAVPASGG